MAGLVIPVEKEDKLDIINDSLETLGDIMGASMKKQFEAEKEQILLQQKKDERDKMISDLQLKSNLSPAQIKFLKQKNEIQKKEYKAVVTQRWYEKTLGFFKTMAESAKGGLLKFLIGLLALAVFDPKGTFIKQVFGFIVSAIKWIVEALRKNLPKIISNMLYLITEVIPPLIANVALTIWDLLKDMFKKGDFASLTVVIGGILFILNKFLPVMSVLKPLFGGLLAMLKGFLMFLITNPIGLIITGTIAALAALWIWSDKIAGFFENLFDWFSKLGTGMKIFIGVLSALFFPITAAIGLIYGLVKLFQSIKEVGFVKTMENIWDTVKNFFVNIWNAITGFLGKIWDSITGFFSDVFNWISDFFNRFKIVFMILFWPITLIIGAVKGLIVLFKNIPAIFNAIVGFFKELSFIFKILFFPVTAIITLVSGLIDLFKSFSEIGVLETFGKILNVITGFFKDMGNKLGSFIYDYLITPIMNIFTFYVNFYKRVGNIVKNVFVGIFDFFKDIDKLFITIFNSIFKFFNKYFIKPISKFFKGFLKLFKNISNFIQNYFIQPIIGFFKDIGNFVLSVFGPIKTVIDAVANIINAILQPIIKLMAPVLKNVGKVLEGVWNILSNYIMKGFNSIMSFFKDIGAWFEGAAEFGLAWFGIGPGAFSGEERERYQELERVQEKKTGFDLDRLQKIMEKEVGARTAREKLVVKEITKVAGVSKTADYDELVKALVEEKGRTAKAVKVIKNFQLSETNSRRKR
jgi:phage-related protein